MTSTGETRRPLSEDALFDAYLEACRSGAAEEPAAYFARHPHIGPDLRTSIEALWAGAGARRASSLDRLGDCDILEPLDRGGMGLVYLARQRSLDRLVVVKVIRPELRTSDTARARFRREAEAAAKLHHPHLVQVLDVGEEDDVAYLVMEYVPGRSLDDILAERPRPGWTECVRWILQLARAVHYTHTQGVIHRDVKPSNVRIDRTGAPKLIDFGVARTEGATRAALTTTFAGSPLYAAPEQLTGRPLDGRADVYGLGATLYECVTGRPPFPGESLEQVLREVLVNDPIPPRRLVPALPKDLESVLLKAIEKDPERRYKTSGALADDLAALLDDRPVAARPPRATRRMARWARRHPKAARLAVAALLLTLFGVCLVVWQHHARASEARRAVAEAERLLVSYTDHIVATRDLEGQLAQLRQQIPYRYLTDEENRLLNRHEADMERRWRERDQIFRDILHELRRAERLDPDVEGTDSTRSTLFMHKWREAERRQDLFAASFFRGEAERLDPALAEAAKETYRVSIRTTPPGAEVHLFVVQELAEEPRWVPAPVAGTPARRPGSLVVVDGHRTAAPLFPTPEARQGTTPLVVRHGRRPHIALLRLPGHVDVRLPLRPGNDLAPEFEISLPKRGSGPTGFVYVVAVEPVRAVEPFWAMRHEVTAAQYREFLHATGENARAPREGVDRPLWTKREGKWVFPASWRPDWPVLGISWHDAQAYATWRTGRDSRFRYALPTFDEWRAMGGGRPFYVFGDRFRPRWVSSCFARPTASPVPVMSYPIDESVFGIYDMTGSAFEWLDAWYDEDRGLRRLGGGAWGHADPEIFKLEAGMGERPERVSGSFGVRLIARLK